MKTYLYDLGFDLFSFITDIDTIESVYEAICDYLENYVATLMDIEYIQELGFDINDFNDYLIN